MLCTNSDDFIADKCIWVAELQDGTKVFQDDDRPGLEEPSAWKRLSQYIKKNPHNPIVGFRLRFRSNVVYLPNHQSFYFYSHGLVQVTPNTNNSAFHIVGWPHKTDQVMCEWYRVPELILMRRVYKDLDKCKADQIIYNF
jgi:hypothetical protein